MARNRQRAKERRARRPPPVANARGAHDPRDDEAPEPLAHASPDVELAEAQLALGRPELSDQPGDDAPDAFEAGDEDFDEQEFDEADIEAGAGDGGRGSIGALEVVADGDGAHLSAAPIRPGNRLVNFVQGSWRELQRVQWPDRRQVIQATGVVLGFVIVAGVFLGVADFLAGKLVTYILK